MPLDETCTEVTVVNAGSPALRMVPRQKFDGNFGVLTALDLQTGQRIWTERTRATQTSAVLATAGGLVFNADLDRWFRANDAKNGKERWRKKVADEKMLQ